MLITFHSRLSQIYKSSKFTNYGAKVKPMDLHIITFEFFTCIIHYVKSKVGASV